MDSVKQAIVIRLSSKFATSRKNIKKLLEIRLKPADKGSYLSPIEWGTQARQSDLMARSVQSIYWQYLCFELRQAINDRDASGISGQAATLFARAAQKSTKYGIGLQLVDRVRDDRNNHWRVRVDLGLGIENLRKQVERRSKQMTVETELLGKLESVHTKPLKIVLRLPEDTKQEVGIVNRLKQDARDNWDSDVVVRVEMTLDKDRNIIGIPKAISISPIIKVKSPLIDYLESRGKGRSIFGTKEGQEYIASLRGNEDDAEDPV
jgi:hypothetical protein